MNKIVALLLLAVAFAGCKKDEIIKTAGKGGNAVIHVYPQHHGVPIDSCMVYVKYNTQDMASTFDDSVKAVVVNGESVATFTGLKGGSYYFYGMGYDPAVAQPVHGGTPFSFEEETNYNLYLPITE